MSKKYKTYVDDGKLYKNGRANNDYKWKESEDGLYKFINDNDGYKYVFDYEPRESGTDCETSYLSANIFLKLIEKYYKTNGKVIFIDEQATYKQYYFTKADGTAGSRKILYYKRYKNYGEVVIGFDVMNNPNEPDKKNKFPPHILYELYKDLNEFKVLKAIYHTIGNFTFFPRSKSYERKDEFQTKIHNETFRENWNKSLNYLKKNWEKYQFDGFCEFEDYIKMSMQQFYTVKGWEQIKEIVCNGELEKLLESKTELKKLYQNIKDCTDEINCKDYDKDDIKVINAIIKIRSKLIIMMLNGELI